MVNIPTRLLEQVPLLPSPAPASIPVSDMSPAGRYVMRPITQSYLNGTSHQHYDDKYIGWPILFRKMTGWLL